MGQHRKPLSDVFTDPDVFAAWKDEGNFYIHLIDKEITISFSKSDFNTFVKNMVRTRDVSKYLEDLKWPNYTMGTKTSIHSRHIIDFYHCIHYDNRWFHEHAVHGWERNFGFSSTLFYFGKNDVNIVAKTPSKIINPTPINPRLTQEDESVMNGLICQGF